MKKKIMNVLLCILVIFLTGKTSISQPQFKNENDTIKLKNLYTNFNSVISCSISEIKNNQELLQKEDFKNLDIYLKSLIKLKINDNDLLDGSNRLTFDESINPFNIEKSKKISKSFKVSPSTRFDLENKFGKVQITSWDKNEISIEVGIVARANTERKAQEMLDRINIEIIDNNEFVSFKTKMENINNMGKGDNKSFEINYVVNMPTNNPLKVKNSFGDMYLGNFNGKTDIDMKYGGLRAEKLTGSENLVRVAFGSGSITYIKNGKLDISYSDFSLGSGGNVDIVSSFSDIKLDEIGDLDIKNKYGKVNIGSVASVSGSNSFADFKLKNLASGLDMKVRYCGDFHIKNIAKNFKQINIDGGYSHFDLNFGQAGCFNFDVNVSFGNADIDHSKAQFNILEKKNTSVYCKGKFGKGTSQGNVIIKSNYGDVNFESNDK